MTDMETIILFSFVLLITLLHLIYRKVKFNPWKDEYCEVQPRTEEYKEIDDFLKKFWDEQEKQDRVFEERMIELSRRKHLFDKLKAPKPKWIHQ